MSFGASSRAGKLCIVAGGGDLPTLVAKGAWSQGLDVVATALDGEAPTLPEGVDLVPFHLERLGGLMYQLRGQGVTDIVMAGGFNRPQLDWRKLDARTLLLIPRILRAMGSGDDSALRSAIAVFEAAGFRVRGAHEFVPELLASSGPITSAAPNQDHQKDAFRGQAVLDALGPQDVGQACVFARGQCLGIESLYGTNALLEDLARRRDDRQPTQGGVLVKRPKQNQELRADMPVIGPQTVRLAAEARLTGICLAAGGVMILEASETVAEANRLGVCIWAT